VIFDIGKNSIKDMINKVNLYNNKYEADLTLARGRLGIKKMLLGSIALGLVTYAACPVLVVK